MTNFDKLFEQIYFESQYNQSIDDDKNNDGTFNNPKMISKQVLISLFKSKKDDSPYEINILIPNENTSKNDFLTIVPDTVNNEALSTIKLGLSGKESLYDKLKNHSHKDEQRLNYTPIIKDLVENPLFIIFMNHKKGDVYYFFKFNKLAKKTKRWIMGIVSVRNDEKKLFDVYGVDKEYIADLIKSGTKIYIEKNWAIGKEPVL